MPSNRNEPITRSDAVGEPEIGVHGERLIATTAGALYWPAREMLIVADLHFEKGAALARRGVLLPPYDTRTTLKRLQGLCRTFEPKEIVSLGDAFHESGVDAGMEESDAALLESLMRGRRFVWVLGNHDPKPPARFAGEVCEEMHCGALTLRHAPSQGPAPGELAGHLHPSARVRTESRIQRRRCFASDGARLILPAFGAYAGGLNVLDATFDGLFGALTAWVIGARAVYPIASRLLVPEDGDAVPGGLPSPKQNRFAPDWIRGQAGRLGAAPLPC